MNPAWGTARIIHGNALDLPLEDASVDLVVTSPPYFSLRSYQDNGEHMAGQIGSEATPAEFVDALIAATAEMVRVLKPSGSIWVNLGDKYSTYESRQGKAATHEWAEKSQQSQRYTRNAPGVYGSPYKSLMGIPWRYALGCMSKPGGGTIDTHLMHEILGMVDQGMSTDQARGMLDEHEKRTNGLGLILRAEVIWSKPNGLPESVTDRVRRSHETWFHFTKEPRYYSAVDEIREAHTSHSTGLAATFKRPNPSHDLVPGQSMTQHRSDRADSGQSPLGKLPGSVWTIATQPLTVPAHLGVDHFAAFPMEWPRRIIRGWSPAGVCVACGQGRRPIAGHTEAWTNFRKEHGMGDYADRTVSDAQGKRAAGGPSGGSIAAFGPKVQITGYACDCPDTTAPTTPGVVLDPFSGTGTTALVAKVLGREGIGVDLSEDYCRLARWRTTDPGQIASAMEVAKPAPQVDGQGDLFDFEGPAA